MAARAGLPAVLLQILLDLRFHDQGNIGPVADALLDALKARLHDRLPGVPRKRPHDLSRQSFRRRRVLNESGMENHPLTPMSDPNLVRVLQRADESIVGLIRYDTIAKGAEAVRARIEELKEDGVRMAIADAVSDADLYTIGQACRDLSLVTGGSGIALGLPQNFHSANLLVYAGDAADLPNIEGGSVVLAGSASKATNAQVAEWRASRPSFRIDPIALSRGEPVVERAVEFVRGHDETVLIYATTSPDEVKLCRRNWALRRRDIWSKTRWRPSRANCVKWVCASSLSRAVRRQAQSCRRSMSARCASDRRSILAYRRRNPLAPSRSGLALKSGNFGTIDFFAKALEALNGAQVAA